MKSLKFSGLYLSSSVKIKVLFGESFNKKEYCLQVLEQNFASLLLAVNSLPHCSHDKNETLFFNIKGGVVEVIKNKLLILAE